MIILTLAAFMASVSSSYGDYVAQAMISRFNGATSQSLGTIGVLTLTQKSDNKVYVTGTLSLAPGFTPVNNSMGFHVHNTGNLTGGCDSVGAHYNPDNYTHGGPQDKTRHVGDLGNVVFFPNNQSVYVNAVDSVIQLVGKRSVVGRAIVLHMHPDDLGRGGNDESLKTGNADGRYACGIIALESDFSPSGANSYAKTTILPVISVILVLVAMIR